MPTSSSHPVDPAAAASPAELDPARREAVFASALRVFGRRGYRRALTADIAQGAGMSKGLLFFYFRNKRELYFKTVEWLLAKIEPLVLDDGFWQLDDFFDVLLYAGRKTGDVLARFPFVLEFSLGVYYPDHRDVRDGMGGWLEEQTDAMLRRYFKNVRFERFREDVDPRHVVDMLAWLADGYLSQQRRLGRTVGFDALMQEMAEWCAMLKQYAYREEYR